MGIVGLFSADFLQVCMTMALIADLGNDNFYKREEAHAKIQEKMDVDLFLRLKKAAKTGKDLEIKWRANWICQKYIKKLRQEYRVDLHGYGAYPQIDLRLGDGYRWKGHCRWMISVFYLNQIEDIDSSFWGHPPHYMRCRLATQLWMDDRINADFKESLQIAKNGREFRSMMDDRMKATQTDIEVLIEADKKYYKRKEIKNPFLGKTQEKEEKTATPK